MELSQVTPLILTYNEAPNIRDTLSRLQWAARIVVVDSHSTDETLQIVSEFPNVELFARKFDHFADQCNYGLTMIRSTWVLSLDADYKCPRVLPEELRSLDGAFNGYRSKFIYCIYGKPLRATLYPPRIVLYRKDDVSYCRDGHAHKVAVDGQVGQLETVLLHDDWKPLSTWFLAQLRYADEEAKKLCEVSSKQLGWKDRIRKCYLLVPVLTLFYCLFWKGLVLDGWRGVFYTLQRVYAELLLSLMLLDRKLRGARSEKREARDEKQHVS